jgi:hypothetical protein
MNNHSMTLNFNEICRLCLLKEGEMSSIFAVPLPKRIMSFVSFEVSTKLFIYFLGRIKNIKCYVYEWGVCA